MLGEGAEAPAIVQGEGGEKGVERKNFGVLQTAFQRRQNPKRKR
jgi:hypothetical protein